MIYKYPSDLFTPVRDNWQAQPFGVGNVAVPNQDHFIRTAEHVYQASMLTEEQRRIPLKVLIGTPEDVAHFTGDAIRFDQPTPISAGALIKLAPAIDTSQSMLAVANDQIWGIVDIGGANNRLNTGFGVAAFTPPALAILTSREPGQLIAEQGDEFLAELLQGELRLKNRRDIFAEEPIAGIINAGIESLRNGREAMQATVPDAAEEKRICRSLYLRFIFGVLRIIRDRKHGGSLLLFPHDEIGRIAQCLTLKNPLHDERVWNLLIQKPEDLRDFLEKLADLTNFTATLSGVDGAIVLDTNLAVRGFGARINSRAEGFASARVAGTQTRWLVDSKGTRHSSAMKLCHEFGPCIAFVVSQDGSIRAISKDAQEVLVWPDVRI